MRRRILRIALLLAALALAAVGFLLTRPPDRSLPTRPHRVVRIPNRTTAYEWTSGHTLATLAFPGSQHGFVSRVDTRRGVSTVVPNGSGLPVSRIYQWWFAVSPDRTYALFGALGSNYVTTLDPIKPRLAPGWRRLDLYELSGPLWFPDSRRWAFVARSTDGRDTLSAVVQAADRPAEIRRLHVGQRLDTRLEEGDCRLLGWTTGGRLLAVDWKGRASSNIRPTRRRRIHMFEMDATRWSVVRDCEVSVPVGPSPWHNFPTSIGAGEEVALSPTGDRLAWLLWQDRQSAPIERFLSRWLSWLRPSRRIIVLCTTRIDGTGMREIGWVDAPVQTSPFGGPKLLRWMPDGKRLSFLYKDWLWTVPAE